MDHSPDMESRVLGNNSVCACRGSVDIYRMPLGAGATRCNSGMGRVVLSSPTQMAGESRSLQHRLDERYSGFIPPWIQERSELMYPANKDWDNHVRCGCAERMAERLSGIDGVEIEITHTAKQYWATIHAKENRGIIFQEELR